MREYGRHALLGMVMVVASLVATKLMAMVAHVVVGWLLTSDDYKIWGFVLSLGVLVDGFRHGGALPIIQQWGERATTRARAFMQYCLIFHGISALVLVLLIPAAHRYFRTDALTGLVIVMAIRLLPLAMAGLYRTLLEADLRFASVAKRASLSAFAYYVTMVLCAAAGMGPFSLAIPLLIHAVAEWVFYREATGPIRDHSVLTLDMFLEVLRSSKWVMLSAIGTSLAMMGDYLVIGRMRPDLLGPYLFGFQQTVAFSTLVVASFNQVLLPTFAKMQDEPPRMATAFRKSANTTALLCGPVLALAAVAAPMIVHLVWLGKWDAAIPVVQVMSFCLVFRLFNPLAVSSLQATARWRILAGLLLLDALAVLLGAWLGARIGTMSAIAISVGIARFLIVPVMIASAARGVGIPAGELLRGVAGRTALPVLSVLLTWWALGFPGAVDPQQLVTSLLTVSLASLVNGYWYRGELRQILRVMRPLRGTSVSRKP